MLDRLDQEVALGSEASRGLTVTETHLVLYAGLAGDLDPMMLDENFASASPGAGRTAPLGLLVGMAVGVAHELLPPGRFKPVSLAVDATGPVRIGETLNCLARVESLSDGQAEIRLRARTDSGVEVLSGKLIVTLTGSGR